MKYLSDRTGRATAMSLNFHSVVKSDNNWQKNKIICMIMPLFISIIIDNIILMRLINKQMNFG
jgi:hypothetical protein